MIMYIHLFFILLVIDIVILIVFGPRLIKTVKLKKDKLNTYAIQNNATGKCIRPYNASFKEDEKVILFTHHNWECMTWQMINIEKDIFLLKNLYSQKTFEPVSSPQTGVSMHQKTLQSNTNQYWQFIASDENYLIKLKDYDLYLTAQNSDENANIILNELTNEDNQKWKLIEQQPIM